MTLRDDKRVRVRGEILQVCEALFRKHGFEATSIDDIVAGAEISRQTFFNYFPGKDAVVTELAIAWLKGQADLPSPEALGKATKAGKSLLAEARRFVVEQARAIEADRTFMALVIAHAAPIGAGDARTQQAEQGRNIFLGVAEIIRAGQASGEINASLDPVRAAEVYVSAMLMTVRLWLLGDWAKSDTLVKRVNAAIDVLEGGLKAPRKT
jgi:AcrR family transcriptional regulator